MYKGRDVIGKPVISYDMGEQFDRVEDLIFDQNSNEIIGFLVQESGWFSSARVLLLKDVQAIGPDAVITYTKNAIVQANEVTAIAHILEHNNILKGTRILTNDGRNLGNMVDLYFDANTGVVEGYEVSGGLFADAYTGRSFVPAPQTLKIGKDVAFVPTEIAKLMEEQVGGIKAAMQSAGEKAQETAQVTVDKLQEFGQIAGEKAQETTLITVDKLQEVRRSAATSLNNIVINPQEQKTFVIGKVAKQNVTALNGEGVVLQGQIVTGAIANTAEDRGVLDELYRSTGGSFTERVGNRVNNAVASLGVEQAQGRRVQQFVRAQEGPIIAAPGQIVTDQVIKRAKTYHQEQALLNAVGLDLGEAVRDRTNTNVMVVSDRLKSTTQIRSEQLQEGAKNLWEQVRGTASKLQDRSTNAIEEQQIKGALGRPVNRVILDQADGVILNVGELITHQAIVSARQSGVLDVLLRSVYTERPQLSLEDLRAPEPGRAAL